MIAHRDPAPTGDCTRESDGGGCHVGTVLREFDHVGAGDELQEILGSRQLVNGGSAEADSVRDGFADRVDHRWEAMAERDRA